MKERVGKRGLSPVIASVLMVLLVLVLSSIIFLWARGFIGEQIEKFGQPIEGYCDRVEFRVSRQGNNLEVTNYGNVDIRHLELEKIRGGNSETERFTFQVDAQESLSGYVDFNMADGEAPEKVVVYPALIGNIQGSGSNSVFTCINSGITL